MFPDSSANSKKFFPLSLPLQRSIMSRIPSLSRHKKGILGTQQEYSVSTSKFQNSIKKRISHLKKVPNHNPMTAELHRHYSIGPELGRGRFGVVRRCTSLTTGAHFAVKSIDKTLLRDPTDRDSAANEAKLTHLAAAGNPNSVQIHAVFEDSAYIHLVLDLLPGPDLFDRLSASAPLSEPEAAKIFLPMVEAVATCHRRGIAHRDIKPDNFLFDGQDRLRLVDFGSAESFGEGRRMRGVVGTPYYVAPEVVEGREYDEKVDVWSAGVVLYVVLAGMVPFYGESAAEIFEKVARANLRFPKAVFADVSPAAKDLIRRMLCKDVSRRLSAEQVLRHPWVTSGGGARSVVADRT